MRKNSFVIVNIREMISNYTEYNRFIKKIKWDVSITQSIFFMYYYFIIYLLNFFIKTKMYFKYYEVNTCYIETFMLIKNVVLKIYDNGVSINNNEVSIHIPYEYIISLNTEHNRCLFKIIPSFKNKLVSNNTLLNTHEPLTIFLKTDNNNFDNLTKDIKKNMFYHLKYNKIDLNVFKDSFYLKRKND